MNDDHPQQHPNIFPGFRYQDAPAAIDWLERAFGFEPQFVVPGPDGTIAHAQLKLGPGLIMLDSAVAETAPAVPWPATRLSLYVYVPDIEAHYERARAAGAEIIRVLAETDYGSFEFSALDLEGNLWSFGTYQPFD